MPNRPSASDSARAASASGVYPIRTAMDLTVHTLARRGRGYRTLVVGVVTLVLLVMTLWLVVGSSRVLAGLSYLVPACSLYFCWDAWVLVQWRRDLFRSWTAAQIEFSALRQGLGMNAALPQRAVNGMLATLPMTSTPAASEIAIAMPTRTAIERTQTTVHAFRNDSLILHWLAHVLMATAISVAVWLYAWQPLLVCGAVLVLPMVRVAMIHARVRALSATLDSIFGQPDFQASSYAEFATSVDWSPIPARVRAKLVSRGCVPSQA